MLLDVLADRETPHENAEKHPRGAMLLDVLADRETPHEGSSVDVTAWDPHVVKGTKLCAQQAAVAELASPPVNRRCGVIHLYHIPKTGGTSLLCWLVDLLAKGQLDEIFSLYSKTTPVDLVAFEAQVLEPILQRPAGRLVAVHHHHRAPGLFGLDGTLGRWRERLQASGCDLYQVTALRDPSSRLYSALYFQANKLAPQLTQDGLQSFILNALKSEKNTDNYMVRYVLNNHEDLEEVYPLPFGAVSSEAASTAAAILRRFNLVWFVEDGDDAVRRFAGWLGLRDSPVPHANANEQKDMSVISGDIPALILERTSVDDQLCREVRSALHGELSHPWWAMGRAILAIAS